MPKPCIGPRVSRVLRTSRSKVPCKTSDFGGISAPLDDQQEEWSPGIPRTPVDGQQGGAVGVCAKFIGEKPAGYQPAARCSQNSSQRPLSWEQRRAIIALAWLTVQRIPDCFSRCPMIVLQPASTTPEPTKRPWLRNWA